LRMGLIPLDARHVHRPDHLAVVGLSALGSDVLQAMHRLEVNATNVSGALITDTPPLAFQQAYDRLFGELTAGHEGSLPFGAFPVACYTAQPFDVFVRACP
jgi:hypothetical protein